MENSRLTVSDMDNMDNMDNMGDIDELQELIDDAARSSRKHLVFQDRLEQAISVLNENHGDIPPGYRGVESRMLKMAKDLLNKCERRSIIGSGCLNDDNVIELLLNTIDDDGTPAKVFLNMDTTDVRHRAVLRHMGSVDLRKNKIVPIFPFAYGFE